MPERIALRPRVKICGVCRPEDAAEAAAAGADYVGVILASGYPRTRSLDEAEAIYGAGNGALRVGVFVDDDVAAVIKAVDRLHLDVVQLHGDESIEDVRAISDSTHHPCVWKAVRPRDATELESGLSRYGEHVDAILLDGWSARGEGGVGAPFSWELVSRLRGAMPERVDLVTAGGLGAENVKEIVRRLSPDVVDVSSGVEETLGRKSAVKMRAFIAAATSGGGSS